MKMRKPFSHSCLPVYKKQWSLPHRPSLVLCHASEELLEKKDPDALALLYRIWPCVRWGAFLPGLTRFPWCARWKGSHRTWWWMTGRTGKAAGNEHDMMALKSRMKKRGNYESHWLWTAEMSVVELGWPFFSNQKLSVCTSLFFVSPWSHNSLIYSSVSSKLVSCDALTLCEHDETLKLKTKLTRTANWLNMTLLLTKLNFLPIHFWEQCLNKL